MPPEAPSTPVATPTRTAAQPQPENIKDTLISIMIAFTMAFVFRGFVIEAFVIPTGSMGPTLLGAHMPVRGEETGYSWPVGAFLGERNDNSAYVNPQPAVDLQDPIGGQALTPRPRRTYSGDRILVLKYLYGLRDPARFEVIVFKNPHNPAENYIKRLIGLPGEQIALADGDVFVRTAPDGRTVESNDPEARAALWAAPGWKIARKNPTVQRAVWQLVYDSSFAPLTTNKESTPWRPSDDKGWRINPRVYSFDGTATSLVFDQGRRRSGSGVRGAHALKWTIDDYYPFDEPSYGDLMRNANRFPVSDIRLRCGFTPATDGQTIGMNLSARGHEFRATLGGGTARIDIRRPNGSAGIRGEWETVATQPAPALSAGKISNVEFWHVDQSVQIWLDGVRVAEYDYDWSPAERIYFATGHTLADLMRDQAGDPQGRNVLSKDGLYKPCTVGFEFAGGPFFITRIGLDRDLHYQPTSKGGGISGLATSPYAPLLLGPDQFFACGDNSPFSSDGRLWDSVDPWVNELYPPPGGENSPYPRAGVIPRDLLLGRAFFVYWPSLKYDGEPLPMPDFGRMRFIW